MEDKLTITSREEATKTLKEKFKTDKFTCTATFHIPKNIQLKEGTKPFGYFQNIQLDGSIVSYPKPTNGFDYNLRMSFYQGLNKELEDGQEYSLKLSLAHDNFRIQQNNPYLLRVDSYEKIRSNNVLVNDITSIVKEIFKEKLDQNSPYTMVELANSVESLATDIYSENKRFIYELIQNADDSAVTENAGIEIQILPQYLIISHNGKPFDARDIRGLCGIGIGTKKNDSTKTGYKGIGFKSVFGQPEGLVYVKTADTLFRFDKMYLKNKGWNSKWNSKWGTKESWEIKEGIEFSCPWQMIPINSDSTNDVLADKILNSTEYTVKTAIKINDEHKLLKDIKELFADARFLLFLRKIKKVSLVATSFTLQLEKKTDTDTNYVTLLKNETILSNWYIKSWLHKVPNEIRKALSTDTKTPKKLQEIERTELSFAFQLNSECNEIHLLTPSESPIYTYLPTSVVEYELPFLINSNFLLDAGREKIHKDRVWNQWLFKVIGYEIVVCCAEFAKSNFLQTSYLDILKSDYYAETDELRKSFNSGLKEGFRSIPFIPNSNDDLILLSEAVVDEVEILEANIVDARTLSTFLNTLARFNNIPFENIIIAHNQLKKLDNFNIKKIDEEDLKLFFKSTFFLDQLSSVNNYDFLHYIMPLEKKDFTGSWNYLVRNSCLILTSDGTLEKIPLVCFPINEYVSDYGKEVKLIHNETYSIIYNNRELMEWLMSFDVKEPSAIAFLEKEVIEKIYELMTDENYLQITEFILELHLKKFLEQEHYDKLQNLQLKTSQGFHEAKNCVFALEYNPKVNFLDCLSNVNIVVPDYIGKYKSSQWKIFFKRLNVSDDISFISNYQSSFSKFDSVYREIAVSFAKEGHTYPNLINANYSIYLNYFTFLNDTINYNFSKIFWKRLLEKYILLFKEEEDVTINYSKRRKIRLYDINDENLPSLDKMGWGNYSHNKVYTTSYFFWFLKTKACIPTNQKKCMLAADTFSNTNRITALAGNYLPIVEIGKEIPTAWSEILELKISLDLSDLLSILTSISNDNYKGSIINENKKRISDIYKEILSILNKSSLNDEEIISKWAVNNKIVCTDFKPRKPSDVIWLKIDDFNDDVENLPILFLPEDVPDGENLEKFIKLLNVQIIDRCEHRFTEKVELTDLKMKALEILPAVGLILKSKYKISNLEEYLIDTFKIINGFKFYQCKGLELVLNYNNQEVKASKVNSYKTENELYLTKFWNNQIERFNISKYFVLIFNGKYIAQQIQLLLGISGNEINYYLNYENLNFLEMQNLAIYTEIQERIQEIKLCKEIKNTTDNDNPIIDQFSHQESVVDEVKETNLENIDVDFKTDTDSDENKISFTPIEIRELEALLNRSMSNDEISDIWIIAAFRALKHYENEGFDVSYANSDFDNVISKRYLENVISPEKININVLVRSAKYKLLRLSYNAWIDLAEPDFELFVLTGNNSTDYDIYSTQNEIADINEDSWVMRLDGINKVANIDTLFTGNIIDIKYESMELLIRLPGNTNYNSILCISVFRHTAVMLAITSLSNNFSPKYLLFNLYTNSSR